MELNCRTAETELEWAGKRNPGKWTEHSRFAALACKNIAARCTDLSADMAYCFGLMHDIGRYAGVTSEKHLIDGYRFCMERGWEKAAQICISHAFMIQDIKTSIGTFDVSDDLWSILLRMPFMMTMIGLCSFVIRLPFQQDSVCWKNGLWMLQSVMGRRPLWQNAGKRSWILKRCLRKK